MFHLVLYVLCHGSTCCIHSLHLMYIHVIQCKFTAGQWQWSMFTNFFVIALGLSKCSVVQKPVEIVQFKVNIKGWGAVRVGTRLFAFHCYVCGNF